MKKNLCCFYYYVPKSHLEVTKRAIFTAGAGQIDNYSCCAWQTKGTGQFRPGTGSNAYIGKIDKTTQVIEYKVETICPTSKIPQVIAALKKSHPYETPAFGIIKLANS